MFDGTKARIQAVKDRKRLIYGILVAVALVVACGIGIARCGSANNSAADTTPATHGAIAATQTYAPSACANTWAAMPFDGDGFPTRDYGDSGITLIVHIQGNNATVKWFMEHHQTLAAVYARTAAGWRKVQPSGSSVTVARHSTQEVAVFAKGDSAFATLPHGFTAYPPCA